MFRQAHHRCLAPTEIVGRGRRPAGLRIRARCHRLFQGRACPAPKIWVAPAYGGPAGGWRLDCAVFITLLHLCLKRHFGMLMVFFLRMQVLQRMMGNLKELANERGHPMEAAI